MESVANFKSFWSESHFTLKGVNESFNRKHANDYSGDLRLTKLFYLNFHPLEVVYLKTTHICLI